VEEETAEEREAAAAAAAAAAAGADEPASASEHITWRDLQKTHAGGMVRLPRPPFRLLKVNRRSKL